MPSLVATYTIQACSRNTWSSMNTTVFNGGYLYRRPLNRQTHSEECRSHVGLHVLVVETHDLDQVLQCRHLHVVVWALSRLAHHLHDEVTLDLAGNMGNKVKHPKLNKNCILLYILFHLHTFNLNTLRQSSGMLVHSIKAPQAYCFIWTGNNTEGRSTQKDLESTV